MILLVFKNIKLYKDNLANIIFIFIFSFNYLPYLYLFKY